MGFPFFEFPEVVFLPLAVKDLTLGGAEFIFRFQLKNPILMFINSGHPASALSGGTGHLSGGDIW
jgi:hypothetical protein